MWNFQLDTLGIIFSYIFSIYNVFVGINYLVLNNYENSCKENVELKWVCFS